MTLSHLTPSLSTCRALAAAGFPQATLFAWMGRPGFSNAPGVVFRSTGHGRSEELAAPTLDEVLAHLPAEVPCAVPHPIYGTVERQHALRIEMGERATFGYHVPGSFVVQHRTEHEHAVEAAARLFIALRASDQNEAPADVPTLPSAIGERMAQAA